MEKNHLLIVDQRKYWTINICLKYINAIKEKLCLEKFCKFS